jgi:hypothetical protein
LREEHKHDAEFLQKIVFQTKTNNMDPDTPISLFDALANRNYEGMIYLYALNSKKSLLSASRLNGLPYNLRRDNMSGKIWRI